MKFLIVTLLVTFSVTVAVSGKSRFFFVFSFNFLFSSGSILRENKDEDIHHRFDKLLFQVIMEKVKEQEHAVLHLSEQYDELVKTKDKNLKTEMLRELAIASEFLTHVKEFFERHLKRTDLNMFEHFNYSVGLETTKILMNELTKLEKKINEIQ